MIKFRIKVDFDIERLTKNKKQAQIALDEQVRKDSNFYIPKQYGNLEGSSNSVSKIGEGLVAWDGPYARRLYYNPQYNFSKSPNPNARGLWFEAAKAKHLEEWKKIVAVTLLGGK